MAKITTPEFRLSYPQVFEPKAFQGGKPRYSLVMLFSKKTDIFDLKKLALDAIEEKWPNKNTRPKRLRSPFRDGDTEKPDTDGYTGCIFVSASKLEERGKVPVVDKALSPITDPSELYAGCYCKASVNAYAYEFAGNTGVAFGLRSVQKIKEGEPFGVGKVDPTEDFEVIETDVSAMGFTEENAPTVKESFEDMF